jgi:flavin reductase (NADH)/flavin reductase/chlorophenol-4-monooxygenase component 1
MVAPIAPEALSSQPVTDRFGMDVTEAVASAEFRAALTNLTTAVSIIATNGVAGPAGLTCSAVCAAGDTPATMVACVGRRSAAHDVIIANGVFSINCLPATRMDLSQLFAGVGRVPMTERFAPGEWDALSTGAPVASDALVAFDCKLIDVRDVGTHGVFIGCVVATRQNISAEPLIFHRQQYATTRPL